MAEPGVGVAIPVYNGERFLEAALRSVLAQSHPVGDVIVVDDGSDDASEQVARAVGPPVRVVRRPHSGPGAARSLAMNLVRGQVILPFDGDDLLTPTSIEARMQVLLERPEVDIVFGQVRTFRELSDGRPVPLDQPHPAHVPSGMLIRRTAYRRVGPFAPGLRVAECLDWLLRAREIGLGEVTVPDHTAWRRVHGANNSLTERGAMHEFPRALKASLDRRRASGR